MFKATVKTIDNEEFIIQFPTLQQIVNVIQPNLDAGFFIESSINITTTTSDKVGVEQA